MRERKIYERFLKRYSVQAKRKGAKDDWTEWTNVDDHEEALKHAKRAENAGFEARIIDNKEGCEYEDQT